MDALTKEEKDAALEKRMEEIRRKNKEREQRHKEIVADKRHAEEQNASISAGTPERKDRHGKGTSVTAAGAAGESTQPAQEPAGVSDGWGSTSYREEWPERDEADEPQYWQQSRQRGGRDSHPGQWTRGGSAVAHGTRTGPADVRERLTDTQGRRPGGSPWRGGNQSSHGKNGLSSASEDNDASIVTAASIRGNSTSATSMSQHAGTFQSSDSIVRSVDRVPDVANPVASIGYAAAAPMGSVPSAGIGTGRGRGRGIVVHPEGGWPMPGNVSTDRAPSRGGSQMLARHNMASPQQHERRHAAASDIPEYTAAEEESPLSAPQGFPRHVRGEHQRSETFQQSTDGRRPEESSGRHYPGQQQQPVQPATDRAQRQQEQRLQNQQNYEETRKKNAAAYEESLRSNASNTSGSCGGFLADRSRDVQTDYSKTNEELRQLRQQQANAENSPSSTVRHQRNFGGATADLEQVKSKVKEVAHERQENHRGKPVTQRDLELQMTGHERQQYAAWREDRDRIDRARLDRARGTGGSWRRAWDVDKSAPLDGDPSAAPHEDRGSERSRDDADFRYRGSKDQSNTQRTKWRSPDHGGDRTAPSNKTQAHTSEEYEQPVSLTSTTSKNTKPSVQERPKRSKVQKSNVPRASEDQVLGSEARPTGRGSNANTDTQDGGNDSGASVGSPKVNHDGSGDGVHNNVKTDSSGQTLLAVSSAKGAESTAPVDDAATSTVALNVAADKLTVSGAEHEAAAAATEQGLEQQQQQQCSEGTAAVREAVSPAHSNGDDDEWEDVDDDNEECDDGDDDCELSELDGCPQRHVTDWAAEVENEYGCS